MKKKDYSKYKLVIPHDSAKDKDIKDKDMALTDTATFDVDSEMSEEHAISILHHLIKHDYTVTTFEFKQGLKDSLSNPDYAIEPRCVIRARKTIVILPQPPKVRVDDLIKLLENSVKTLKKEGKINIEIDQSLGSIDIIAWAKDQKEKV